MADLRSATASTANLAETFMALCEECDVVWVVGTFLDPRHSLLACRLPWLCPECYRPLRVASYARLTATPPC
jgi:hypothetical protein